MKRYFEIKDDFGPEDEPKRAVKSRSASGRMLTLPARWYLHQISTDAGVRLSRSEFTRGEILKHNSLHIRVQYEGDPLDITLIAMTVPVVTRSVGDLLTRLAKEDIQRIPATVTDHEGNYDVLNVLTKCDCFDEARSMFDKWEPNSSRPDKAGELKTIYRVVIDPTRVSTAEVFRLSGWPFALIVSERIKCAIEELHVTGVRFHDVTPAK